MSDVKERMHNGELYRPDDPEVMDEQLECQELMVDFNATRPSEGERRVWLMRRMLAECGEGCWIEPPFHANFGGHHVHFGDRVYANFNLTCVDDTHIYVGDATMFGPNVTLATAAHPIDAGLRGQGYQYNRPIRIGSNCWFGAGVTVLPGVTIGDNVVVGAGSVVTHDLPSNVVAVGVPCRVLREVTDADREEWAGRLPGEGTNGAE
ncbi:MAG: sugar O-acetyltransferase [Bifidobacterium sp.]|nr:sugar O-acetyltransferase [Bifidobacterium sp.]